MKPSDLGALREIECHMVRVHGLEAHLTYVGLRRIEAPIRMPPERTKEAAGPMVGRHFPND